MIETQRLILMPLTYDQLSKYVMADHSLETELNVNKTTMTISNELKDALEKVILPSVANPDKNYLYSTLWSAIDKQENTMIGDICFFGEPNENGEIEVGYGTYEDFRGKRFMIEALEGMIGWARKQSKVKAIIASTDKSNVASYTILERNQFIKAGETDDLFNWRLDLV
ncbi:GNAT family N-acetyltransferase [Shewanella sp. WE21]|uniref:GNAT family N-acetyltransferase n=1 Tax=Shewanella sp. WE21 TaxID=2029986 RepID=UPI000CF65E62|nr:GNAT family N-acetyltransferase [Shewanella sp. WE21]AVI65898.1 GNAT family N-acetyltransferase [Shewanella sp. WE21]